jgi:hypothetical protein
MSIDWGAVSGAASAAAAIVAVAGIALAYRGVRISRDGSILNRRNYLDGIFVRWIDSIDVLDRAAIPFLRHTPTQSELDSGSADLPDAYSEFHLAFMHCKTATNLLGTTGLFDSPAKHDQPDEIATDELIPVFQGILWAYYFSVNEYSPAEAAQYSKNQGMSQDWRSAIRETEARLAVEDVPEKYFPMLEAKVRELYPEASSLSVWQASDRLLDICKSQIANRYVDLVSSRFPWYRGS